MEEGRHRHVRCAVAEMDRDLPQGNHVAAHGDSWKSVGQVDLCELSVDLSSWCFPQNSWLETEDCIKEVDPDLITVTSANNLYDYAKRDTAHDVRTRRAEDCQNRSVDLGIDEYRIARGRVLFIDAK